METGTQIITKILEGERNPKVLAQYRDWRIKASEQTLIKSLEGNWREELKQIQKIKEKTENLLLGYQNTKGLVI